MRLVEHGAGQHGQDAAAECTRGAGVTRIARQSRIQFGFPTIQPGAVVTDGPGERGDRRRAADDSQQEVGGGVVAHLQGGGTQIRKCHRLTDIRLGTRGIGPQQLRIDHDGVGEPQLPRLGLLQHSGREVGLERRAHREQVAVAVRHLDLRVQVLPVQTDESVVPLFQCGDARSDRRQRFGRITQGRARRGLLASAGRSGRQHRTRDEQSATREAHPASRASAATISPALPPPV